MVVDDGSTDGTKEVVIKYAKKDSRIKLLERNRGPKGAPTCRNIGATNALGEYLLFLDSDDMLADYCLKRRLNKFSQHPEADFIVYPTKLFHHHVGDLDIYWNKPVADRDDLTRFMDFDTPWQTSGPIWKKSSFIKLGGFDEEALSAQDWELHIRALINKLNYVVVADIRKSDVYYRRHEHTISNSWLEKNKILNRVSLLDRVFMEIIGKGLPLTKEMKRCYAGNYFRSSLKLYLNHKDSLALKTFVKIKTMELLPEHEYYFWWLYLYIQIQLNSRKNLQTFSIRIFDSLAYRLLGYQFNSGTNRYFLNYHWVADENSHPL
ncbi:glycosyl transferase family 2 [Flammeovirgaceae bacterium 311]|nr:glycosyl transferase family 2 [Flammeovirgaceae bacterium 311]